MSDTGTPLKKTQTDRVAVMERATEVATEKREADRARHQSLTDKLRAERLARDAAIAAAEAPPKKLRAAKR